MKKKKKYNIAPTLRGHHLVCLHFFSGEGFEPEFQKNLNQILSQVKKETIVIAQGADSICIRCEHIKNGKCEYQENQDEGILKMDTKALQLLELKPGERITWIEIKRKLSSIFKSWYESYCIQCDWQYVCKKNHLYDELSPIGTDFLKKHLPV